MPTFERMGAANVPVEPREQLSKKPEKSTDSEAVFRDLEQGIEHLDASIASLEELEKDGHRGNIVYQVSRINAGVGRFKEAKQVAEELRDSPYFFSEAYGALAVAVADHGGNPDEYLKTVERLLPIARSSEEHDHIVYQLLAAEAEIGKDEQHLLGRVKLLKVEREMRGDKDPKDSAFERIAFAHGKKMRWDEAYKAASSIKEEDVRAYAYEKLAKEALEKGNVDVAAKIAEGIQGDEEVAFLQSRIYKAIITRAKERGMDTRRFEVAFEKAKKLSRDSVNMRAEVEELGYYREKLLRSLANIGRLDLVGDVIENDDDQRYLAEHLARIDKYDDACEIVASIKSRQEREWALDSIKKINEERKLGKGSAEEWGIRSSPENDLMAMAHAAKEDIDAGRDPQAMLDRLQTIIDGPPLPGYKRRGAAQGRDLRDVARRQMAEIEAHRGNFKVAKDIIKESAYSDILGSFIFKEAQFAAERCRSSFAEVQKLSVDQQVRFFKDAKARNKRAASLLLNNLSPEAREKVLEGLLS